MNDRDFIYWLHGYFELQSISCYKIRKQDQIDPVEMHNGHIDLIREHIELVRKERKDFTELSSIVEWIDGALINANLVFGPLRSNVRNSVVQKIAETMIKVTETSTFPGVELSFFEIDSPISYPPIIPMNPCLKSAKKIFEDGESIYANPTGAGIMTC